MKLVSRLLLLTSTPLQEVGAGKVLAGGSLNNESLELYARIFDEVVLFGKLSKVPTASSLVTLSNVQSIAIDIRSPRGIWKYLRLIRSYCANGNTTVCGRLPSVEALLGLLCAPRTNIDVVEMVGDAFESMSNRGGVLAKWIARIFDWETKRIVWHATAVRYVTNSYLQTRYPTGGLSFSLSDVNIREFLGVVREQSSESLRTLKMGMLGEIASNLKGLDLALDCLSSLRRDGIDIELEVVGRGAAERWQVMSRDLRVEDHFHLLGALTHTEVATWLGGLDLFILPSRQEGMPRALVEAMAVGLPCVAADVGGVSELLEPKFLHRKNDASELVRCLKSVLDLDLVEVGAANRRRVQREFSPDELARAFISNWSLVKSLSMSRIPAAQ